MSFDPTKPVQTRDGRKVVLWERKLKGGRICGAIEYGGHETVHSWLDDGMSSPTEKNSIDLVNVPQEETRGEWLK